MPKLRFKDKLGRRFTNWTKSSLGSIGETFTGLTGKTSAHFGRGSRYIQYLQVFENSKVDLQLCGLVEIDEYESQNPVKKGDIFFTISSETPEDVGIASVLLEEAINVYLNSFCFGYRADSAKLLPEFARYALRESTFRRKVGRLAQGSTRFNLSKRSLMSLSLWLPTIVEQQKIAIFLTAIDEKIDTSSQKKSLLEQYKLGLMQKLFDQELRFKDEQDGDFESWQNQPFTSVFEVVSVRKHQIPSKDIQTYGPVRVVDQGKTLIAGYSSDLTKLFETEGVIVYGDHTTVVKYVDFDFIVGADGTKVLTSRNRRDKLKYLYYCLVHHNIAAEGYKRHFSILKQIQLPIPHQKEQQKIADFLSAIDEKIELVNTQIDKTRTFKKGLLQQLFV